MSLLRQYVSQLHPLLAGSPSASLEPICRALWLCRKMLKKVLTTGTKERPALDRFMKESCVTFLHCYQTFYPTDALKWQGLGELLLQDQKLSEVSIERKRLPLLEKVCQGKLLIFLIIDLSSCSFQLKRFVASSDLISNPRAGHRKGEANGIIRNN